MIAIFNRKELLVTFDLKKQAKVRDILAANNVEYYIKTVNRMSPSPVSAGTRGQMGTAGQRMKDMYEYIIYVKKCDYKKASYLIK